MILAPAFPTRVQMFAELLEENSHGIGVIVGLAHGIEDVAFGVHANNQGDPWLQRLFRLRAFLTSLAPLTTSKIGVVQPRLVDIDDYLLSHFWFQEPHSPCLSQGPVNR